MDLSSYPRTDSTNSASQWTAYGVPACNHLERHQVGGRGINKHPKDFEVEAAQASL